MKYVALLRGINVGGNTKVPMVDLKKALEELGYTEVKTLLNSGNAVFEADKAAVKEIEDKLERAFGFPIAVILRDEKQIEKLIDSKPFANVKVTPSTLLYVSFTDDEEIINALDRNNVKHTTDLMKELDKKYGKRITTRNWNTIEKVSKILNED
jgi:uncharacterized protein (DUF1697 family)